MHDWIPVPGNNPIVAPDGVELRIIAVGHRRTNKDIAPDGCVQYDRWSWHYREATTDREGTR